MCIRDRNLAITLLDVLELPLAMNMVNEEVILPVELNVAPGTPANTMILTEIVGPDAGAFEFFNDLADFQASGSGNGNSSVTTVGPSMPVIAFIAAPDFEMPSDANGDGVFEATLQFTNLDIGALVVVGDFETTILDVADAAPVITSATAVSVAENETTVLTATATDADAGDTLTFSLSGTDSNVFAIDAMTGAITFASAPDFETPSDADGDNIFNIDVIATDAAGLTDTQALAVTVTDAAVESGPALTNSVDEEVTFSLSGVTAAVGSNPVTVTLVGPDAAAFGLSTTSGLFDAANPALTQVNLTMNSDIFVGILAPADFEMPGDANMDNVFEFSIQIMDDVTNNVDALQDIEVTILDVTAPIFTNTVNAAVDENQTTVATLTATDDDGDPITFSLSGTDQNAFNIDPMTGVITFVNAPDFEMPSDANMDNIFEIDVSASDGTSTTTDGFMVFINDIVESPPPIMDSIPEGTRDGQTFSVNIPFGDSLTFTLIGPDAADIDLFSSVLNFTFDSPVSSFSANFVTFSAGPGVIATPSTLDFENPTDANMDNIYEVTLVGTDDSTGQVVVVQDYEFTITDDPADNGLSAASAAPSAAPSEPVFVSAEDGAPIFEGDDDGIAVQETFVDPADVFEEAIFVADDVFEIA